MEVVGGDAVLVDLVPALGGVQLAVPKVGDDALVRLARRGVHVGAHKQVLVAVVQALLFGWLIVV